MVWPGRSLAVLAVIVGVVLLLTGLFELWTAIRMADADTGQRMLALVNGLLLLIAGIFCVRQPGLTALTLTLFVGLACVVGGIADIYRAVTGEDDRLVTGVGGGVTVLIGVVVLVYPMVSAAAAVWLIGAGLVVLGAVAIVRGIRGRSARPRPA
jgi:uncharacterized membrane protein HdeD (DUF308 family)